MLSRAGKRVTVGGVVMGLFALALSPRVADAHFVLEEPPSWMSEDSLGLPQKLGPCGDELDGTDAATPTGVVTTVQAGQKITVTIHEVIFHPGHYRISLAENRSQLPVEPVVTVGSTPCGTAAIQSPPVFPVLADGVFVHTTAFTTPQSIEITLPPNVTCTKCTLQVIEFMAEHPLNNPGGCFYHHCADLSIRAPDAGASVPDAGKPAASDAATGFGTYPTSPSGCGCRLGHAAPGAGGLAFLGVLGVLARRRRRARRS